MNKITDYLLSLESILDIDILYAAEGGSRAYGYANLDSDYDVRIIYKRKQESYLSINPPKDLIELKFENMDIVGWDIHKFCKQIYKGNAAVWEWLRSDHIYLQKNCCLSALTKSDFHPFFNKYKILSHYYYVVLNQLKIFSHSTEEKKIKSYCFIAKTLLSMIYIDCVSQFPISLNVYFLLDSLVNAQKEYGIPSNLLKSLFDARKSQQKVDQFDLEDLNKWFILTLDIFSQKKSIDSFDKIRYSELEMNLNKIIYLEITNSEKNPWMEQKITEDANPSDIIS